MYLHREGRVACFVRILSISRPDVRRLKARNALKLMQRSRQSPENGSCQVVGAGDEGAVKVAANLRKMPHKVGAPALDRCISPTVPQRDAAQLARLSGTCINQRQRPGTGRRWLLRRASAGHGMLAGSAIATHIVNVIRGGCAVRGSTFCGDFELSSHAAIVFISGTSRGTQGDRRANRQRQPANEQG